VVAVDFFVINVNRWFMSELKIKNFQNVSATIPNCCGNCLHNQWDESGPHCTNTKNWKLDDGETEINMGDDMDDGVIQWDTNCDNHKRGQPLY